MREDILRKCHSLLLLLFLLLRRFQEAKRKAFLYPFHFYAPHFWETASVALFRLFRIVGRRRLCFTFTLPYLYLNLYLTAIMHIHFTGRSAFRPPVRPLVQPSVRSDPRSAVRVIYTVSGPKCLTLPESVPLAKLQMYMRIVVTCEGSGLSIRKSSRGSWPFL